MQPQTFFREKFDVLVIAGLFLVTFTAFLFSPNPDLTVWLKDFSQAFLYALLALVGVRVRAGSAAIGSASTESGDIISQPPPADPAKENNQNEIPTD